MEPSSSFSHSVALDSVEVAQGVIRSLRSRSATQSRFFSQGSRTTARELNRIIETETQRHQQQQQKITQINEAIDRFDASAVRSSVSVAESRTAMSDSDDDFDDDDASSRSRSRKALSLRDAVRSSRRRQERDDFANACDFDAADRSSSSAARDSSALSASMSMSVSVSAQELDDFDCEDDEETQELFKGFVAPTKKTARLSQSLSQSQSQSNVRTSGSAGGADLLAASARKGVTIKPGQAIRVKPLGSKSKRNIP